MRQSEATRLHPAGPRRPATAGMTVQVYRPRARRNRKFMKHSARRGRCCGRQELPKLASVVAALATGRRDHKSTLE